MPRILLRPDSENRVGMIFDAGEIDPALDAILRSGTGQIECRVPNPRVWRMAALKHAYLAACLALGEVPDTDHAAAVRAVLVATRDRERGQLPPETGLSKGLRLARSHQPAQGPTVLLVALVDAEGRPTDYGVSFAGTLFVSWPLDAALFWEAVRRLGIPRRRSSSPRWRQFVTEAIQLGDLTPLTALDAGDLDQVQPWVARTAARWMQ